MIVKRANIWVKIYSYVINYGVKTGYNTAFIIDNETKKALIAADPNSADIIKPVLRGRDIKRYQADWAKLWLIATFPSLHIDIDKYPSVKDWLQSFLPKLNQTGEEISNDEKQSLIQRMISLGFSPKEQDLKKCRKATSHAWFEVQDTCAYHAEFSKEKIVYPDIMRLPKQTTILSNFPYMYLDKDGYFPEATNFVLTSDMIRLIFAILASKLGVYIFLNFYSGPIFDNKGFRYKKAYLGNFPIPLSVGQYCSLVPRIESLVNRIFASKAADPNVDTSAAETEIDQLVYQLYSLANEEITSVESWLALQR